MIYQVIEAGWVFEIEAPDRCQVVRRDGGKPVLMVVVGDSAEAFEPHALVRAAKDNLLGLTCSRSWRIDAGGRPLDPAQAIREVTLDV